MECVVFAIIILAALTLKSLFVMQGGSTPLTMASQQGQDDVVQLLLDRGAHIDHPTKVSAFLFS